MNEYDEAIANGIALLDKRVPDWCKQMQLDHLHMGETESCVLGQLFGEYANGLGELGLREYDGSSYGFNVLDDWDSFGHLTRRWKHRIRQHCEAHDDAE